MTERAEGHYFASRELAERAMSQCASDGRAAVAHKELADRYEALAVVFGVKSRSHACEPLTPPQPDTDVFSV